MQEQDTKERIVAHTPGPWRVDEHEILADDGDVLICNVELMDGISPSEWQSNMRLLSAAPDLLAALKSVVAIGDEAWAEWDADNDMRVGKILIALSGKRGYRADIDAIHAAIEKAEGRA